LLAALLGIPARAAAPPPSTNAALVAFCEADRVDAQLLCGMYLWGVAESYLWNLNRCFVSDYGIDQLRREYLLIVRGAPEWSERPNAPILLALLIRSTRPC